MRSTIQGSPGLFTAINPETAPPGSLRRALGVVIRRPGIIQKERPFRQYSYGGNTAFDAVADHALDYYGGFFYVRDANGSLYAEIGKGNSGFTKKTIPIPALNYDANDLAFRSAQSLGNWYAPFATGVLKLDTPGATGYLAGCPKGLDPQLTLVGGGTLLTVGQSVAYRVCWKRIDANRNLVLGAPSGRAVVTATGNDNVTVKAFLPPQIVNDATPTAYYIQVYRSLTFATGVAPDDECGLVYDAKLTATDTGNGYASFTDATPDNMRGASLYTNPSQQGIWLANDPPPVAQDSAYFKGSHFLANTKQKSRAQIAMLAPPEQLAIQSIAANTPIAGQSTYTLAASADLSGGPTSGIGKLAVTGTTGGSNDGTWAIVSANNGAHTVVVINVGVNQAGVAGIAMTGILEISASLQTGGGTIDYDLYPVFGAESVANHYYSVPSAGTVSQIVLSAAASLVRIINQVANARVVAYGISGPDDPSGLILLEEAGIGTYTFSVGAFGSSATPVSYQPDFSNKWAPAIPEATAGPLSSLTDARSNRLYISKSGQPEHMPIASYIDVGAQGFAILRIIALREALLVFKQDGLFRVTGTAGSFSWAPYDLTQVLIGKSFVTTIQNQAAALTRKGLFLFSETGFKYLSAPVADLIGRYTALLVDKTNGNRSNVPLKFNKGLSASETDGMLYLYLNDADSMNPVSLSYGIASGAWSQSYCAAQSSQTGGDGIAGQINFPALNFIQLNGVRVGIEELPVLPNIFIEDQWNNDAATFAWGTVSANRGWLGESGALTMGQHEPPPAHKYFINITNVNAGAMQITATAETGPALAIGSLIQAGQAGSAYKVTVKNGNVLTLAIFAGADTFGFTTGQTYQYVGQPELVEWNSYTADDEAVTAQWAEASVILDPLSSASAGSISIGFFTESSPESAIVMQPTQPLQSSTLQRVGVPQNCQVARRLALRMQHSNPLEFVFIKGVSYEYEKAQDDRATN